MVKELIPRPLPAKARLHLALEENANLRTYIAALEAQLAEARKALERIEVRTRSVPGDTAEDDKRDKYHANSIARRALRATTEAEE